jgi:nucleotide-binding universal stress UspA family protein
MSILAAIDFSDVTDRVVDEAADLAAALRTGLVLLHVAQPYTDFFGEEPGTAYYGELLADSERQLEAVVGRVAGRGLKVEPLLLQGTAGEIIVEQSERVDARLIVMGSHGHGAVFRLLVGSVTDAVMRRSRRAVVIVPSRE